LLVQKRLVALMSDVFGVPIAGVTLEGMSRACAARLKEFAATVRGLVTEAPVKHMDETGLRIGGKTQWLHVACTVMLTFYRTCAKRGSLLAGVAGIVVHDHWKPYYTMTGVLHALCNAHHLRELKALVEIEKEDCEKEDWARQMQRLLRLACHAANLARQRGRSPEAGPHCLHGTPLRRDRRGGSRLPRKPNAAGAGPGETRR
jgi:transposase